MLPSRSSPVVILLRAINLAWYAILLPLWLFVLALTCLRIRERSNAVYCAVLSWLGVGRLCTPENVDDGELPLSVLLALIIPPYYFYALFYIDDTSFVQYSFPLMMFYFLVCSDSCHYESHLWLKNLYTNSKSASSKRSDDRTWFHRVFGYRFKQYAFGIFYPLPQHLPHLLVHHKVNMANEDDVDWVGDLNRDSFVDFCKFLSRFDWRTYLHGLDYIARTSMRHGTYRLLVHMCLDLSFTFALYAVTFYLSPRKFLFQYIFHSLLNYRLAWITFFVEHVFHHPIDGAADGGFDHPWHTTTLFDENEFASDSHAAHHWRAVHAVAQNSAWANSVEFVRNQLKHRNLALRVNTRVEEWIKLPWFAMTKQYGTLVGMIYWIPESKLQGELTDEQIAQYRSFQSEITPQHIQMRLQKRPYTTKAAVHPAKQVS